MPPQPISKGSARRCGTACGSASGPAHMGDPPYRPATFPGQARDCRNAGYGEDRMRARSGGATIAVGRATSLWSRRRRLPGRLRRTALWGVLLAFTATCCALALNQTAGTENLVAEAVDRAISVSAALGLVVTD